MQCFGPECFCVDSNGATIEGTLVSITQGRPDCKQPTKGKTFIGKEPIADTYKALSGTESRYFRCICPVLAKRKYPKYQAIF